MSQPQCSQVFCVLTLVLAGPSVAQTKAHFTVAPLAGLTFSSASFNQTLAGGQIAYQSGARRVTVEGQALFKRDGRVCVIGDCAIPRGRGIRLGIGFDQSITRASRRPAPYVGVQLGVHSQEGEYATAGVRAGVDFLNNSAMMLRTEVGLTGILGADYHDLHVAMALVVPL